MENNSYEVLIKKTSPIRKSLTEISAWASLAVAAIASLYSIAVIMYQLPVTNLFLGSAILGGIVFVGVSVMSFGKLDEIKEIQRKVTRDQELRFNQEKVAHNYELANKLQSDYPFVPVPLKENKDIIVNDMAWREKYISDHQVEEVKQDKPTGRKNILDFGPYLKKKKK